MNRMAAGFAASPAAKGPYFGLHASRRAPGLRLASAAEARKERDNVGGEMGCCSVFGGRLWWRGADSGGATSTIGDSGDQRSCGATCQGRDRADYSRPADPGRPSSWGDAEA